MKTENKWNTPSTEKSRTVLIEPYSINHNIPQLAITTFTNETKHNKIHKRSRRIIDKNLKPSNNTMSTGPPTGPKDIFVEHYGL